MGINKFWKNKKVINILILCVSLLAMDYFRSFLVYGHSYPYDTVGFGQVFVELSKNAGHKGPLIIGKNGHYGIYNSSDHDIGAGLLVSLLSYYFNIQFEDIEDLQKINLVIYFLSLILFSLLFLKFRPFVFFLLQCLLLLFSINFGFAFIKTATIYHGLVCPMAILTFVLIEGFMTKKTTMPFSLKLILFSLIGVLFGMTRGYFNQVFIILVLWYFLDEILQKRRTFFSKKFGTGSSQKMENPKRSYIKLFLSLLFSLLILFKLNPVIQNYYYGIAQKTNPELSFKTWLELYEKRQLQVSKKSFYAVHQPFPPPYKHGVWHGLFLGLGFFDNAYGIFGADVSAYSFAKREQVDVLLHSEEYERIIRRLYFQYIKEHPLEYIKNILLKTLTFLRSFPVSKSSFILFLIMVWLLCYLKKDKSFRTEGIDKKQIVPFLIFLMICIVVAPYYSFSILTYTVLLYVTVATRTLNKLNFKTQPKKFKMI